MGLRRPGQRRAVHHRRRRSRFQMVAQLSREQKLRQSMGRRRTPPPVWRMRRGGADAGPGELLSRDDLGFEPAPRGVEIRYSIQLSMPQSWSRAKEDSLPVHTVMILKRCYRGTAMRNLSISARCADVLFLQRMLNKRGAKPQLAEGGMFGPALSTRRRPFRTRTGSGRLMALQTGGCGRGLVPSWNSNTACHFFGQPTNTTCWSAVATMITGNIMSIGPGSAKTGGSGAGLC